jgi:hypothetical protein
VVGCDAVVARRSQPITRRAQTITRSGLIRPDFPGLASTLGRHMQSTHPLEDALRRLRTRTDRCWRRGCAAGRASFFVWLRFSDLSYTPGVVGDWARCDDIRSHYNPNIAHVTAPPRTATPTLEAIHPPAFHNGRGCESAVGTHMFCSLDVTRCGCRGAVSFFFFYGFFIYQST